VAGSGTVLVSSLSPWQIRFWFSVSGCLPGVLDLANSVGMRAPGELCVARAVGTTITVSKLSFRLTAVAKMPVKPPWLFSFCDYMQARCASHSPSGTE